VETWQLLVLAEILGFGIQLWALVNAARKPAWAWDQANKSKLMWLIILGVGLFFPVLGLIVAVWYLLATGPEVKRMQRLGPPIGFPGRGSA
jgi:hypothetical protein